VQVVIQYCKGIPWAQQLTTVDWKQVSKHCYVYFNIVSK